MPSFSQTDLADSGMPRLAEAVMSPMAAQIFVSFVSFLLQSKAMKVASSTSEVGRFKGLK